jgi:cytoskeletal protein CcmA (bactofilin family)
MPSARNTACLGASIEVKGRISGEEDLQVDGKVEGPVALNGQRLTVGRTGQLSSEITAREVVVYGKVTGNLRARDRVEIKKDGSVVGDIWTARISIEDGAYFKGRIEIERSKSASESPEEAAEPVSAQAD